MGILAAVGMLCANAVYAAENSGVPFSIDAKTESEQNADSLIKISRFALESGMSALSEMISRQVVEGGGLSEASKKSINTILSASLISQGRFEEALPIINEADPKGIDDEANLQRALIYVGMNNPDEAERCIEKVRPANLPKEMLSWYYLARGYIFYARDKFESARKNFEKSLQEASSVSAKADSALAISISRFSEGLTDDNLQDLAESLKTKCSLYIGTEQGANFAKQYAVVLNRLGKRGEALELIEDRLLLPLMPDKDVDDFKLLKAMILRDFPERSNQVLKELMYTTKSPEVLDYAIRILRVNFKGNTDSLEAALSDVLKNGSQLVRDKILIELAFLAVKKNDMASAAKYANDLLKNYPASQSKKEALRILTWTAFSEKGASPAKFRLAANYLLNIASLEDSPEDEARAKMMAADCYFLGDKDYESAVKIYVDLLKTGLPSDSQGTALNRAAESMLKLGKIKEAEKTIDAAYSNEMIKPDEIWNAEWALLNAMRSSGKIADASKRVDKILADNIRSASKLNPVLMFKMQWLQAKFANTNGRFEDAVSLAEKLVSDIESQQKNPEDAEILDEIASAALLIRANSLVQLNKQEGPGGAFENFVYIREKYPSTEAAQISSLMHAQNLAQAGKYTEAAKLCKELADTFPQSPRAALSLFEAAQYLKLAGSEDDLKQALTLLDRLCKDYPSDARFFYARMMQGDILRIMNRFPEARAIYSDLINTHSAHPEIYSAWMGLGDSQLANPDRELDAAATFERLYSLANIPFEARAEAAFKWGFAMSRLGRDREAAEIWLLTTKELAGLADRSEKLGKYWLGRSMLELAKNLERLGLLSDARAAYKTILDKRLAGESIARKKLGLEGK